MAKRSVDEAEVELSFSQLRLLLTDDVQERYEVARPLLLQQPVTVAERGAVKSNCCSASKPTWPIGLGPDERQK